MVIKLRKWETEDAEALAKNLNNKKIQDNLRDGLAYPFTVSDAEAFIAATKAADESKEYVWAIIVDDKVAGSIGVYRRDSQYFRTAEIGYYVAEEYWGKGIMTEAVKQACTYIFENTDIVRISADPFIYNTASHRVLEKAGFSYEGTLRSNAIKGGKIIDMKLYAIVRE